jgi:small subunit ribosomal protein S11
MSKVAKKGTKKRKVKVEPEGVVHIKASFNNIIISICNRQGQVVSWSTAGRSGFKGSKKNTPYAAQMAATTAAQIAFDGGMRNVQVYVKGPGSGREAAIRAIDGAGLKVTRIQDLTPIPHNGCRPPKKRRV